MCVMIAFRGTSREVSQVYNYEIILSGQAKEEKNMQ